MRPSITHIGANAPKRKVKRIRESRRNHPVSSDLRYRPSHKSTLSTVFNLFPIPLSASRHDHQASCSTSEDIIELQDVRMSPIASLRNRHYPPNSENFDLAKFPPSFRISRTYGASTRASGLRHRSNRTTNRPRMLHALRRGASAIKANIPKIKDVNIIDKYSRVIFPVSFLAFNIGYWVFYVFE